MSVYDIIMPLEKEGKRLSDGVYDITDVEVEKHWIDGEAEQKVKDWLEKHPDGCVADPYETGTIFLLSKVPVKLDFQENVDGELNYGSAAIINNCPKRILICAQND